MITKPKLASGPYGELCIGVTGHRTLTDLDLIEAGIDKALYEIERLFPGQPWRVISSLAEGADRVVVRRVMARKREHFRLTIPLPLEESDYIEDFKSPQSKEDFRVLKELLGGVTVLMPPASDRSRAYAVAGSWLVEHSDILVAVWDGQHCQGEGGTGDVVAEARRERVGIAWVRAGNRIPGTDEQTSLGPQQGTVSFEQLEYSAFGHAHKRIQTGLAGRDSRAMLFQHRRVNFAKFATALGPAATVLLAVQALLFQQGGPVAVWLIGLEVVALALALSVGFFQFGRSHQLWILERLRAELLRREGFLLHARVGPYMRVEAADLSKRVDQRLLTIDNNLSDPVSLLDMRDEEIDWRDELLKTKDDEALPAIPNFRECLGQYLEGRLEDQRRWHALHSELHGRQARLFESGAKLVLVLALIGAAVHLGTLAARHPVEGSLHTGLAIVLLSLPLLGSALVGFLAVLGSQRLSRSYLIEARTLQQLERQMMALRAQAESSGLPAPSLELEFKRAVLKTEEVLSSHLRSWWLIMVTEAPRAGG